MQLSRPFSRWPGVALPDSPGDSQLGRRRATLGSLAGASPPAAVVRGKIVHMSPVTVIETTIPTDAPDLERGALMLDLAERVADLRAAGTLPRIDVKTTPIGHRFVVTVDPRGRS